MPLWYVPVLFSASQICVTISCELRIMCTLCLQNTAHYGDRRRAETAGIFIWKGEKIFNGIVTEIEWSEVTPLVQRMNTLPIRHDSLHSSFLFALEIDLSNHEGFKPCGTDRESNAPRHQENQELSHHSVGRSRSPRDSAFRLRFFSQHELHFKSE